MLLSLDSNLLAKTILKQNIYYNGAFVYYNTEEVNGKEQLPLHRAAHQCSTSSREKATICPNSIHIHSYLGTHHRRDYFLYYGT